MWALTLFNYLIHQLKDPLNCNLTNFSDFSFYHEFVMGQVLIKFKSDGSDFNINKFLSTSLFRLIKLSS